MKEHKGGDVDFEMPIASNINDKTFAVIIANEKYQMEKSVEFATNDGKVFMEYCKRHWDYLRKMSITLQMLHSTT